MNRQTHAWTQKCARDCTFKTKVSVCFADVFFRQQMHLPLSIQALTFCFSRALRFRPQNQRLFQTAVYIIPMKEVLVTDDIYMKDVFSKATSKRIQSAYVSIYVRLFRFKAYTELLTPFSDEQTRRCLFFSFVARLLVAIVIHDDFSHFSVALLCVATRQLDRPRFKQEQRNILEINLWSRLRSVNYFCML